MSQRKTNHNPDRLRPTRTSMGTLTINGRGVPPTTLTPSIEERPQTPVVWSCLVGKSGTLEEVDQDGPIGRLFGGV